MRLIDADLLKERMGNLDGFGLLGRCIDEIPTAESNSDEDCISRQAAIDAFERFIHELGIKDEPYNYGEMALSVRNVPPATPKPKTEWIPVSERLPETAFGCLVTVEEDDRNGEPQSVLYPDFVGYDGETWNDADGVPIPFEVIAWMPLPEPYKPTDSEKE